MTAPRTYAEWVFTLDRLQDGTADEAVLAAMRGGVLEWQLGVAERFTKKLTDVVNFRANRANDRFQRDMGHARGQEGAIVQALLALRKEMAFLSKVMDLPAIPEKDRTQYRQLIRAQADGMQTSLEESSKQDRSGKMASIVRNHKINAF